MISTRAQSGIRQILSKAVSSRLVMSPEDSCDIRAAEQGEEADLGKCNAYVLTISSMQFRILLVLRTSLNEATQQYYIRGQSEKSFEEVFLEVANLCCGAVNQELNRYFPDLGMSTPYRISAHCMRFIYSLKPSHLSGYDLTINGSVKLSATVCVCTHAPLDFAYETGAAEAESGELEMF